MSPHISYHPLGSETIRRYVGYLSSQDPEALAGIEYDATGAHARFRASYVAMASNAQMLTGGFDATHGLNLAATQGFFNRFHYLHDARLSRLRDLLQPYTQSWHELLPTWPATERAVNHLGDDGPSSGVFIAADRVGQLMNDAHSNPELQTALAQEFPGEKMVVLWAALTDAYESGQALLEASGVIEPDPHDLTQSRCRTNQTNCEPAGLRLYLASRPATPEAAAQGAAAPSRPDPGASRPAPPAPDATTPGAPAAAVAPVETVVAPPLSSHAAPPVRDPATVTQADWEPAVVMLGNMHDVRRDLVFGPGGFLEAWDDDGGLMNLVRPAVDLGVAVWLDWKEDHLVEEACRAMVDARIGWPDEDFARMAELQFSWDGSQRSGQVDQGLEAFDRWLQVRGRGMRLVSVNTLGDFYVSFLYPAADAYRFIAALGGAGFEATLQDETIPAPPAEVGQTSNSPQRKMPDAPSLAERMRQRSENPEPPSAF